MSEFLGQIETMSEHQEQIETMSEFQELIETMSQFLWQIETMSELQEQIETMSELLGSIGSNKIVDEDFSPKSQSSALTQRSTESIEVPVPQNENFNNLVVLLDTPKIKVKQQFQKNNKNIKSIPIPEVRNYRDQNIYFFSVLIQLCHEIEQQLKCDYKICQVQILGEKKLETDKISLDIKGKQQVIDAYEQNDQQNVQLNQLTLNTIKLNELIRLNFFQVFEMRDMQNYLTQKEVTLNFQIELY